MPFTPEELAEMAAADAEIEATFRLEQADLDRCKAMDREIHFERLSQEKRKVAAQQKAYREANREKYNTYMREYMRKKRAAAGCARPDDGRKENTYE